MLLIILPFLLHKRHFIIHRTISRRSICSHSKKHTSNRRFHQFRFNLIRLFRKTLTHRKKLYFNQFLWVSFKQFINIGICFRRPFSVICCLKCRLKCHFSIRRRWTNKTRLAVFASNRETHKCVVFCALPPLRFKRPF